MYFLYQKRDSPNLEGDVPYNYKPPPPHEQGHTVIRPSTVFSFRRLLRLQSYGGDIKATTTRVHPPQSQFYYNRRPVGHSVLVSGHHLVPLPFCLPLHGNYLQTFTVFSTL